MAILVDERTRLMVQGITGKEGSFHALRNRAYGTNVVANGVLEALARIDATVPIVLRLDGTNADEGRRIITDAKHPRIVSAATMDGAAEEAARLAGDAA